MVSRRTRCSRAAPRPAEVCAVDPAVQRHCLLRLRRIEGQVRGLQRMIDEGRGCADLMTQIASVHEALRAVGRELMRHHVRRGVATARQLEGTAADAVYDELVELVYRHAC